MKLTNKQKYHDKKYSEYKRYKTVDDITIPVAYRDSDEFLRIKIKANKSRVGSYNEHYFASEAKKLFDWFSNNLPSGLYAILLKLMNEKEKRKAKWLKERIRFKNKK